MPGSDLRVRKGLYIYRIFPGAEFVPHDVLPSICLNPLITLPEDLKITAFLPRPRHAAPLLHPVVRAKAFGMVRYSNNFQLDQFGVTGCSLVRGDVAWMLEPVPGNNGCLMVRKEMSQIRISMEHDLACWGMSFLDACWLLQGCCMLFGQAPIL